jgi:Cu2+-exporting ATPase
MADRYAQARSATDCPVATAAATSSCYHCGEPLPAETDLRVSIGGADRPMCCPGCQAVAQAIVDYGLDRFYRVRSAMPPKAEELVPAALERFTVFDEPSVQSHFLEGGSTASASLILEGVACPACCWLIENRLAVLPGVLDVHVNYADHRAVVQWDPHAIRFSNILAAVAGLGYRAHPYDPHTRRRLLDEERRAQLRRIGLAGLMGMQVMMISTALYFGEWRGIEETYRVFLQWTALLLTIPVVTYSAQPFFRNAWRSLRALSPGMDVPVSLGIALAFIGSIAATVSGNGEVYYDSVVMFVFLLLGGRYIEFAIRRRLAAHLDDLGRVVPATAIRLEASAEGGFTEHTTAAGGLSPGDRVLVRPGETVPADGVIVEGITSVDESLITGESLPLRRTPGQRVVGGSLNAESPIHVQVDRVGPDSVLARIGSLVERCQSEKPALTELANRIGSWFVLGVLVLALAVAGYWMRVDPDAWLPITVSVLVVTCPCALALAAPTALAAATLALVRGGIVVARANAVEMLSRARTFVFDKTGTLTSGEPALADVAPAEALSADDCLAIAAALETGSEHPFARAILRAAHERNIPSRAARDIRNHPGEGVAGSVGGDAYFIGRRDPVGGSGDDDTRGAPANGSGGSRIHLYREHALQATFRFTDPVRAGAGDLTDGLRRRGCRTMILSGDQQSAVDEVAATVPVDRALGGRLPAQKTAELDSLRAAGDVVCMVGDGVNDAPVLAGAHVSIAMGGAADLTRANADLLLLGNRLDAIRFAVDTASETMRVVRQNAVWAIGYNLCALPLAAAGWIAPWMAAIGMSLSSLVVVLNSARLARHRRT